MGGQVSVQGLQTGTPEGAESIGPLSIPCSAVKVTTLVPVTNGAQTVAVPTGINAMLIIPPSALGVDMTLKGVSGDTGLKIATSSFQYPTGPIPIEGESTFVLTFSGTESLFVAVRFF